MHGLAVVKKVEAAVNPQPSVEELGGRVARR
jgi:hypothetical protein